jgi:hypothetical protein
LVDERYIRVSHPPRDHSVHTQYLESTRAGAHIIGLYIFSTNSLRKVENGSKKEHMIGTLKRPRRKTPQSWLASPDM